MDQLDFLFQNGKPPDCSPSQARITNWELNLKRNKCGEIKIIKILINLNKSMNIRTNQLFLCHKLMLQTTKNLTNLCFNCFLKVEHNKIISYLKDESS